MRQLRPYQKIAADFFCDLPRAALWAKPGMGKTGSTLMALAALTLADDVERTLVIGPKRVAADVWREEAPRWDGVVPVLGTVVPIVGTAEQRKRALRVPARVNTVNYENIPWLIEYLGAQWPFDTVVADEASKLRGFRLKQGTQRARALGQIAHTKVRRFYELTGTPAANSLAALWGQVWFLDGGRRLGSSFEAFKRRWFQSFGDPAQARLTPLPFAEQQITEALADITLALDPRDWFDLREPVYTRVTVKMPPAAEKVYKRLQRELYVELQSGQVTAFNAAAKTSKLRQVASGSVYLDGERGAWETVHTAKIEALDDLLDELNEPAIVAYAFVSDRKVLLERLPGSVDLATADGLRRFKAGDAQVGLAHPASLGHGVDGLQHVCRTTIFYSSEWDAETREQLLERTGPMRQRQAGLDRPALVYDIMTAGTVDGVILERYGSKASIQEALLGAMRRDR